MTPLHRLKHRADYFGCKEIFVKDESFRFGLKAFKVLGAFYAMASYLAQKLDMDVAELSFAYLAREDVKEKNRGDHLCHRHRWRPPSGPCLGRSPFGPESVVFMPRDSSQTRLEAL